MTVCSCHVTYAFQSESTLSLVKWLSVRLRTKWFWVRVQLQSLKNFVLIYLVSEFGLKYFGWILLFKGNMFLLQIKNRNTMKWFAILLLILIFRLNWKVWNGSSANKLRQRIKFLFGIKKKNNSRFFPHILDSVHYIKYIRYNLFWTWLCT